MKAALAFVAVAALICCAFAQSTAVVPQERQGRFSFTVLSPLWAQVEPKCLDPTSYVVCTYADEITGISLTRQIPGGQGGSCYPGGVPSSQTSVTQYQILSWNEEAGIAQLQEAVTQEVVCMRFVSSGPRNLLVATLFAQGSFAECPSVMPTETACTGSGANVAYQVVANGACFGGPCRETSAASAVATVTAAAAAAAGAVAMLF